MRQKAEEIYHRFVNYEWNDVGEGLKISILEAIETALKEGQKLPVRSVSQQSEQLVCQHCGQLEPCAGNSPETCYHPKVC